MGLGPRGCEAVAESVVFLRHFEDLPDPRQRAKVMYPLPEVLLLCLLAVLAGAVVRRVRVLPDGSEITLFDGLEAAAEPDLAVTELPPIRARTSGGPS
jgi:hypothetical protein